MADRSRSPAARDGPSRRRSRSPRRRDDRPRRGGGGGGGFKWKDKKRDEDRGGGEKRLERGYRERDREPRRDAKPAPKGNSVEDKFGVAAKFGTSTPSKTTDGENKTKNTDTGKPPERAAAPVQGYAEMIIVHVNDRLGTKAAIACSEDDSIKHFKIMVAAKIGRKPHEIMLKRQGERPFKDILSLRDYSISNGAQIDLELDTGE